MSTLASGQTGCSPLALVRWSRRVERSSRGSSVMETLTQSGSSHSTPYWMTTGQPVCRGIPVHACTCTCMCIHIRVSSIVRMWLVKGTLYVLIFSLITFFNSSSKCSAEDIYLDYPSLLEKMLRFRIILLHVYTCNKYSVYVYVDA